MPELANLVADLQAAGLDVGPRVANVDAVQDAISLALHLEPASYFAGGLLDVDPTEVGTRVRAAGTLVAAREATARVATEATDQLALDVAGALHEASDGIITSMRPGFLLALKVVQQASAAGIVGDTDAESVLASENTKMTTAFRRLPAAVATLDGLAGLRDRLTSLCGVGPFDYAHAAYIAQGASRADLANAADLADEERTEGYVDPVWHHSGFRQVKVHRTGASWLAMVNAGLPAVLNTGPEADAVLATAMAEAEAEAEAETAAQG
jgi:hypothetical protein